MRTRCIAFLVAACATAPAATAAAQDTTTARPPSAEAAVGTSVVDRALVGAAESFPASVGKVACFARVMDATDSDIDFVWYQGSAEVTRITQSIKGSPWRTWSTKTLPEEAAGEWRCDIVRGDKVLQSVKFRIQ